MNRRAIKKVRKIGLDIPVHSTYLDLAEGRKAALKEADYNLFAIKSIK
jgi:hypothetical protein